MSYKKVVRDVELILNKIDGSEDLLARLRAIQKSESKEFNKEKTEESGLDKVVSVELTLSNLLGQLAILFE